MAFGIISGTTSVVPFTEGNIVGIILQTTTNRGRFFVRNGEFVAEMDGVELSLGGGSGSGFTSTNSYTGINVTLSVGDTTLTTTMTSKPKFVSIWDSNGYDISSSVLVRSVLNGSTYDIVINSGESILGTTVNAYGA